MGEAKGIENPDVVMITILPRALNPLVTDAPGEILVDKVDDGKPELFVEVFCHAISRLLCLRNIKLHFEFLADMNDNLLVYKCIHKVF